MDTEDSEPLQRLEFYRDSKRIPPDTQVPIITVQCDALYTPTHCNTATPPPPPPPPPQLLLFRTPRTLLRIEAQAYEAEKYKQIEQQKADPHLYEAQTTIRWRKVVDASGNVQVCSA
jgi:hypothetical protein